MANSNNVFDSSSLVDLGTDLLLNLATTGGDIAVSPFGNITGLSQIDNLISSIKRRLFTPKGALGVFVQDINGMYFIDGEYGNGAYRYLSEPLSNRLITNMAEDIVSCLAQEPRISVNAVVPSLQTTAEGFVLVDFKIQYTITVDQTTNNFVITFNPASGTLG